MSYIPIIVLRITNTKQFGKVYKEIKCSESAIKSQQNLLYNSLRFIDMHKA